MRKAPWTTRRTARRTALQAALVLHAALVVGCDGSSAASQRAQGASSTSSQATGASAAPTPSAPGESASASPSVAPSASARTPAWADAPTDPMATHHETFDALVALAGPFVEPPGKPRKTSLAAFLARTVGPGGPGTTNQGNKAIARHAVSKQACLRGLGERDLVTPAQRERCGADLMVPIWKAGESIADAKTCVDVFEFPNRPCELPFVWIGPTPAAELCARVGKRLCTQDEWVTACAGDPEGGPPRRFAYGDELDLEACNTNKRAAQHNDKTCDPSTIASAYATCGTHTEPSGSFPRCRSRFGVFDQHGNVAEIMTRWDREEDTTVSQLKGSAFFYVDVVPKTGKKVTAEERRRSYSDHCAHDPRWHVEPMKKAWHVNYHLGFRCCRDVPAAR